MNDAPTPQNTPSSAAGSYMQKQNTPTIPSTISENPELLKSMISNNPLLLSAIEEKLSTLIGQNSGYFSNLNKTVKDNVYAIKGLQFKQFKIEAEFQADLMELEIKYLQKFNKIYQLRKQYVVGDVTEKDDDLIKMGKEAMQEDEDDDDDADDDADDDDDDDDDDDQDTKGVPFFWLTAMQNFPPIAEMITDRDLEVLKHLDNIRLEYMNDGNAGFKLIFEFSKNDYFSNLQITKYYYYQKELGYNGEFIYDFAKGDEIQWFNNKVNVTLDIEIRKQRNKNTKQIRTIEKSTPTYSFFNFFTPPKLNNGDDDDDDDEIDVELEESLQNDYSIGELIKEKLIPRAVDWFTGDALKYEPEFADEYDDEEEEDEDEEDDDDDDADDDDEEEDEEDGDDDDEEDDDDGAKEKPECKQQ